MTVSLCGARENVHTEGASLYNFLKFLCKNSADEHFAVFKERSEDRDLHSIEEAPHRQSCSMSTSQKNSHTMRGVALFGDAFSHTTSTPA